MGNGHKVQGSIFLIRAPSQSGVLPLNRYINTKCFYAFIVLFFAMGSLRAHSAQEDLFAALLAPPPVVTLDGRTYLKSEIMQSFIESAFSDTLWYEEGRPEGYLGFFMRKLALDPLRGPTKSMQSGYPWLAPYMHKKDHFPRAGVINKWPGRQVSVGIDWPVYRRDKMIDALDPKWLKSANREELVNTSSQSHYRASHEAVYKKIGEIIQEVIPDIEAATGLNISFNAPFSPVELSDDYARIRIVPLAYLNQQNYFKSDKFSGLRDTGISSDWSLLRSEDALMGGVSFTPQLRAQVDGYLLPNEDNTIGLSICKVIPNVGDAMLRALIVECLARSLGFPDEVKSSATHLGVWNREHDTYAKAVSLDGEKEALFNLPVDEEALRTKFGEDRIAYNSARNDAMMKAKSPQYADPKKFPKVKKDMAPYLKLSVYDGFLLSLLYCDALKPGMDKYQAIVALTKTAACWDRD